MRNYARYLATAPDLQILLAHLLKQAGGRIELASSDLLMVNPGTRILSYRDSQDNLVYELIEEGEMESK